MAKILARGAKGVAYTERGTEVKIQYCIVELDSLIASHTIELKKNPKFPAKLQPRDRSRVASDAQVNNIAKNLKPTLLGAYSSASNGAPIVGPDLIVESGNARVVALQRFFRKHPGKQNLYVGYLMLELAGSLKLSKTAIAKAEKPVLVRLRTSRVNREEFVRECNESSVATLSAAEQGAVDAKHLNEKILNLYSAEDGDDISSAANRDFVRAFMHQVVASAERNRYFDADGQLSQDGVRRIRYALCAKAYDDAAILARLSESVDDKIKKVSQALINKAPSLAALKVLIAKKARHPLDVSPHLTTAVRKLAELKDTRKSVKAFLAQKNLGEEMDPVAKLLLDDFDKRKGRGLETSLDQVVNEVHALGHPGQRTLGEQKLPALLDLVKDALKHKPKKEKSTGGQGDKPSLIEVRYLMQQAKDKEGTGNKKAAIKLYKDIAARKAEHPRKAWRARQALIRLGVPGIKEHE